MEDKFKNFNKDEIEVLHDALYLYTTTNKEYRDIKANLFNQVQDKRFEIKIDQVRKCPACNENMLFFCRTTEHGSILGTQTWLTYKCPHCHATLQFIREKI